VTGSVATARAAIAQHLSAETRGLARDTSFLAVGKAATTLAMIAQVMLISHVLGLRQYGVFALTVAFVAIVSKFFDVDVAKATISIGARYIRSDTRAAAGIFQLSYLVDGVLGVAGFVVVAALAPFAGPRLVGSEGFLLFLLYGLTLLGSTVDTTSIAILQVLGNYRTITALVLLREASRVALVATALFSFHTLVAVVALLVVHDVLTGVGSATLAVKAFGRATPGLSLRKSMLDAAKEARRPMFAMIFQTNLISYGRLVEGQAPALLLGFLRGPLEVGVFKIGMAGAIAVGQLAAPAWNAALPRISRLWNAGSMDELRRLVREGSVAALVVMTVAGVVVVVFRRPILELFGGHAATAAGTVLSLAVASQVVNGILFWNDSVLLAAGRAKLAMSLYLPAVMVMLALVLVLGERYGAEGAAGAVLASALLTNVGLTFSAVRMLYRPPMSPNVSSQRNGARTAGGVQ
jgi:O-antigen/teichoic acid export membrane protein